MCYCNVVTNSQGHATRDITLAIDTTQLVHAPLGTSVCQGEQNTLQKDQFRLTMEDMVDGYSLSTVLFSHLPLLNWPKISAHLKMANNERSVMLLSLLNKHGQDRKLV